METLEYDKIKLLNEQVESLTQSGTWELNLRDNHLSWSDGVYKMLGFEPKEFELTARTGLEIIHPDDRERSIALLEDVLNHKKKYSIEKRLISKTGEIIYVRSKATVFKDDHGQPVNMIGVFQNISDFKRSQQELQQQNSFTENLLRDLPVLFALLNKQGRFLKWNAKTQKVTLYNHKELSSKSVQDLFAEEEKNRINTHINITLNELNTELEIKLLNKRGEKLPLYLTLSAIQYQGETCIIATGMDISERLSLLNELKLLTDNTEEAFSYLDDSMSILSFNKQMSTHSKLLFDKEPKKGMKLSDFARPHQKKYLNKILARIQKKKAVKETLQINIDNELAFFQLKLKPVLSSENDILGIFITSSNITNSYKASKALKESQRQLQQVLDSSLDMLCTIDEEGNFRMVSRSSEKLLGYQPAEMQGKPFIEFVMEEDRLSTISISEELQKGREVTNFHNRYRHKKGHHVSIVWSAYYNQEQKLLHGVARDATEQLRAEEQLKMSENRFKSLVQKGADLISILDLDGTYKYVSPTSESILGVSAQYYIDKNFFDFLHPEDKQMALKQFAQLGKGDSVQLAPFRFLNAKGQWRWLESSVSDLQDEPSVQGIVVNSRDVTDTVELQQTVKNATELAKLGGWEINLQTNEHYWSSMTKQIHELPKDYVPQIDQAINFYHPLYREKVTAAVERAQKYGESFDFEAIIITANNKEKWIRAIGSSEFVGETCIRLYGSIQDIHDRKMVEERLKSISNNVPGVLFQYILKPDGSDSVDLVSKGAEQILGITAEEWINDPTIVWNRIEKEGKSSPFQKSILTSAKKLSAWKGEWRYKMPDGSIKYHECSGNPSKKSDGSIIWDSLIVDVTKRRMAEKQVRLANQELKRHARELEISNAELEQFAYVASHDLQEPLRMVSGFLTQLKKKYSNSLDEKGNQYIYYAVDGANRMRKIILDLLEFSQVGKIDEEMAAIDLNEVISEICWLNKKKIEETGAKIFFDNLPTILKHPSPMKQLFQNLISNALKYRRTNVETNIIIKATELKRKWKFSIEDNGIGIEKEYFDKIFNIFQRLHGKSQYSGTGMGLAIVKKIIDNQNGKIWVESEIGVGTTFYFELPKN